jgi:hypothetical protein
MKDGKQEKLPLMSKLEVANVIVSKLINWLEEA